MCSVSKRLISGPWQKDLLLVPPSQLSGIYFSALISNCQGSPFSFLEELVGHT